MQSKVSAASDRVNGIFFEKQDSLENNATLSRDNSPFNLQAFAPKLIVLLALVNDFDETQATWRNK